jgi:hypothetical protein
MTDFGAIFEPANQPSWIFYVHVAASLQGLAPGAALPVPFYVLGFDRTSVAAPTPLAAGERSLFCLGPFLFAGSTGVFSEPVTEWHELEGSDCTGRPAGAGMAVDSGLVLAASTAPVIYAPVAPNLPWFSVIVRGQR